MSGETVPIERFRELVKTNEKHYQEACKLRERLTAYEKQWTDMDYTIGHLRQDNERLRGEVESLNDMLKTHKVIENFKSFEKCAKELADHKADNARLKLEVEAWKRVPLNKELRTELELCHDALEKASVAFGMDGVWPLLDVLKECGVAMRHLLGDHDCDHQGHEQYATVELELTENYLPKLEQAIATINELLQKGSK